MKFAKRVLASIMIVSIAFSNIYLENNYTAVCAASNVGAHILENPSIVKDNSMVSKQKVTWDCVRMGSYPQSEILSKSGLEAANSEAIDKSKIIVDDELYSKLKKETNWKNDIAEIDGEKYKRYQAWYWDVNYIWTYFKFEPVKWRVLSTDGDKALLFSDKILDGNYYNTTQADVTWETCTMRSWLNDYSQNVNTDGIDYTETGFLNQAFSEEEQEAILETELVNNKNMESGNMGAPGGNNTTDKIFLLADADLARTDTAVSYGFVKSAKTKDEARKAVGTAYTIRKKLGNNDYWLRTTGLYANSASVVIEDDNDFNQVFSIGLHNYNLEQGVRPALTLDLSKTDSYSYAGTVCSDGTIDEYVSATDHIQCPGNCTVGMEETETVEVFAYSSTKEKLTKLVDSIKWSVNDESVATVTSSSFVMPTSSEVYHFPNGDYEQWKAVALLEVKGIKEGNAKLTGTDSKGLAIANCNLEVAKAEDEETAIPGSGGLLTLGSNVVGGAPDDSEVSKIFPTDWTLKASNFPIEIKKGTKKEDGTYTYTGTIGIGKSDLLDDNKKWSSFKDNIKTWEKAEEISNLIDELSKNGVIGSLSSGYISEVVSWKDAKKPKISIIGYFEAKCDKNDNIISKSGGIVAAVKWSVSKPWQFFTPIGPFYIELGGGIKIELKASPVFENGNGGGGFRSSNATTVTLDGSVKAKPSISLEGGYGINKVCSVGAKGTLSVPIDLCPSFGAHIEAQAAVHVKLLFVMDWTWGPSPWEWYPFGESNKYLNSKKAFQKSRNVSNFSEMDTSFADHITAWNGKTNYSTIRKNMKAKKNAGAPISSSETTLMNGLMESSLPMVSEINGKKVLIFQDYDSNKSVLNSSILKYSVFEDGVWSDPKAVWDDGYADMYADIQKINDKIYLTWQKEKGDITGDVSTDSDAVLKQMAEKSEICFAEFDADKNEFIHQTYITNNSDCDMMPKIVNDSKKVSVSWVRNENLSLMQETGENNIYYAEWNGANFNSESRIASAVGTVEDYVAYDRSDKIECLYICQASDIVAVYDKNGHCIEALSDVIQKTDNGTINSFEYRNGCVNMISNGVLFSYDIEKDTAQNYMAGDELFGAQIKYCSNGDKGGYVWSTYDEATNKSAIVASMQTADGFSAPVTIFEAEGAIWRYLAPTLDKQGVWSFVANKYDVKSNLNALVHVDKKITHSLDVGFISVDDSNTLENGTMDVEVFAQNSGDTVIDEIEMILAMEDGTSIKQFIPVKIQPGDSLLKTVSVNIPKSKSQQVDITVYAKNQEDLTDCTIKETIGKSDVKISGESIDNDDSITVVAKVCNNSNVDTKADVSLFTTEAMDNKIAEKNEITLISGENTLVTFNIKKEQLKYNNNDAIYLTLRADVENGDYFEDDNVAYVILYKSDDALSIDSATLSPTATPAPTTTPAVSPTATPRSNYSPSGPAINPGVTPTPTVAPIYTQIPSASQAPLVTATPTPTPAPTQAPTTQAPGSTDAPAASASPSPNVSPYIPATAAPVKKYTTKTVGKFKYKLEEGNHVTASISGITNKKKKSVVIPSSVMIDGSIYKITKIEEGAFRNMKKLKSVKFGIHVEEIGKNAFRNCKKLRLIILPQKLQTIGAGAFRNCKKLKYWIIRSDRIASVGTNAFKDIYANAVFKTSRKVQKKYRTDFRENGALSEKARFISNPAKIRYKGKTY